MNEAETRAKLIDPALRATGWGIVEESRICKPNNLDNSILLKAWVKVVVWMS